MNKHRGFLRLVGTMASEDFPVQLEVPTFWWIYPETQQLRYDNAIFRIQEHGTYKAIQVLSDMRELNYEDELKKPMTLKPNDGLCVGMEGETDER